MTEAIIMSKNKKLSPAPQEISSPPYKVAKSETINPMSAISVKPPETGANSLRTCLLGIPDL